MALNSVLDKLNLSSQDGLFFYADLNDVSKNKYFNNRLIDSLLKIKPDAFFCINNEPLILFFESYSNLNLLEKQIWNFNQSPVVFINCNNQWIIKNGFNYIDENHSLALLSNNISDFEYFKIITGQAWDDFKDEFENKNRVDYYLLQNIETARDILISKGLNSKVANSLIGRVIFIRYLIDRKVELNKYGILEKNDFYSILSDHSSTYVFFEQIRNDFNGNLFPLKYTVSKIDICESEYVTVEHLDVIISLLKGDKLISNSITQLSLFDLYDFSIIPIEFISNVYEKFIGVENQAKQGAYYTPLFLVDYIQKETVAKYFEENPSEYNCKIYDPSCGSGIFLVESLRQIISRYKILTPDYNSDEINYEAYKDKLKILLTDNIFGTDKDDNAISVAIFSLYITLLDNLTPKSIVGFQFPILEGTNFFDSDFFDIEAKFNKKLEKHHFNFILGNPPWATRHSKEKQLFEKYIDYRRNKEKSNLEIENREIAEAFLVRVSDFKFNQCCFIVTSKILYKISRKKEKKGIFRKYFFNHFKINQVFELSSVRHEVFDKSNDKAVAPATILFYKKADNIEDSRNNIIKHVSLKPNIFFEIFKLLVIEKYDCKQILQSYFIDEDWIWKVFVYGNILDYHFIHRLKDSFETIGERINNDRFLIGQGVMEGGGDENDFSQFLGYKYINTKKKDVKQYYVQYSDIWKNPIVHRDRNPQLFDKNVLLITEGISNQFKAVCGISYQKAVFKSSLTGVRAFYEEDVNTLKSMLGIFNSSFFSYFIVNRGSSIGIEREQTHDEEKWEIPYIFSRELIKLVSQVEEQISNYYNNYFNDNQLEIRIENTKIEIENELNKLFKISEQEKKLIDYTNTITIPLLKGDKSQKKKIIGQLPFRAEILEKYVEVFVNHFGKRFNSENKYFETELIYSNHTILIKFKIISQPSSEKKSIIWKKLGDKDLLKIISTLSFENLSNRLFHQKDVKGFESDFFYIAKPNQYKSWHPAIAYLDLGEFIDSLQNSNIKENE